MRGKHIFILILAVFTTITFVNAIDISDFSCQNIVQYKDLAIGQTLPEKAPFTDEIINVYLSEEIYGDIILENKTISDFSCTESEEATYKIYIKSLNTVEDFLNSEDAIETYKQKSDSGEIKVKGVGFGHKIKIAFVKLFLKFA